MASLIVMFSQFLESPPEPMALRLTSNLMVGVVRVLNAQYGFYLGDVTQVYAQLRKAIINMQTENINMPVPEAREDAITMAGALPAGLLNYEPRLDFDTLLKNQVDKFEALATPGPENFTIQSQSVISSNLKEMTLIHDAFSTSGIDTNDFFDPFNDVLQMANEDIFNVNQVGSDVNPFDGGWSLDLSGFNDQGLVPDIAMDLEIQNNPVEPETAQPKPRLKRKANLFDNQTELSREELMQMRSETCLESEEYWQKLKKKKMDDMEKQMVQRLLQEPTMLIHRAKDVWVESFKTNGEFSLIIGAVGRIEHPDYNFDDYGIDLGPIEDPEAFREENARASMNVSTPWSAPSISTSNQSALSDFTFERDKSDHSSPWKILKDQDSGSMNESDQAQRFCNYTMDIMRSADSDEVLFFDLIQSSSCTRKVAAEAFFNTLVLATRKKFKVEQKSPFEDILITLN